MIFKSNTSPSQPLSDLTLTFSPTPFSFPRLQTLPVCFLLLTVIKHTQVFFIFGFYLSNPPSHNLQPQPCSASPCQLEFSRALLSLTVSPSSLLFYVLTLSSPVVTLAPPQNCKVFTVPTRDHQVKHSSFTVKLSNHTPKTNKNLSSGKTCMRMFTTALLVINKN